MNKHLLFATLFTLSVGGLSATNYYVNANIGSDENDGTTTETPWVSLDKLNEQVFQPGDTIFFDDSSTWIGSFAPQGSGTEEAPIVATSYGNGESMPLLDGDGMEGNGVVYLYNVAYWEVCDLEITNDADDDGGDRRGVSVVAPSGAGVLSHIYLKNLYIHNIRGTVGQDRSDKRTCAIAFATLSISGGEARFDDIWIDGCVIHDCRNQGIITEYYSNTSYYPQTDNWKLMKITNARITNNLIYNISKNAMILRLFEGGVVEHNVCHTTAIGEDGEGMTGNTMFTASCDGTVFQFNEGYNNCSPTGDADGSMYDADLRSPNTVWQYSYSHDNAQGLYWGCTNVADTGVVVRYNISYNDKGTIFCVNYPVGQTDIYNNTVIMTSETAPTIIEERNKNGDGIRSYTFRNNLIYGPSRTTCSFIWSDDEDYVRVIENNCIYGPAPSLLPDDTKITTDPLFADDDIATAGVDGVKLTIGSSCIDTGMEIDNNGGRDYFGNALYNGLPDIGAHEYEGDLSDGDVSALYGFYVDNFSLQQNPLKTYENLVIDTNVDKLGDTVNIKLVSTSGATVYENNFAPQASYSLGAVCAARGVYIVVLTTNGKSASKKVWVL